MRHMALLLAAQGVRAGSPVARPVLHAASVARHTATTAGLEAASLFRREGAGGLLSFGFVLSFAFVLSFGFVLSLGFVPVKPDQSDLEEQMRATLSTAHVQHSASRAALARKAPRIYIH